MTRVRSCGLNPSAKLEVSIQLDLSNKPVAKFNFGDNESAHWHYVLCDLTLCSPHPAFPQTEVITVSSVLQLKLLLLSHSWVITFQCVCRPF